jgi:hypothetical protein
MEPSPVASSYPVPAGYPTAVDAHVREKEGQATVTMLSPVVMSWKTSDRVCARE